MREGTLLGHVIEHLALELQFISGMEVGFGKTIDTDAPGVYQQGAARLIRWARTARRE